MFYTAYFDARKTVAQGRRVPAHLAAHTDPFELRDGKYGVPLTCWHLARACEKLKLETLVEEGKRYSRDFWGYGRVRVIFNGNTLSTNGKRIKSST